MPKDKAPGLSYCVVIPAHNEAAYLEHTLTSLYSQTHKPAQVVVVNDNSSDSTGAIADAFAQTCETLRVLHRTSEDSHMPGSKVVNAFLAGKEVLTASWGFLVKLDADLILPPAYFETISAIFQADPKVGIAGGFAWEEEQGVWKKNHPMHTDHVRGAFKAYRKECYDAIGGIRPAMGWDTVDELLARYHGYTIKTSESLVVKHLRPTGSSYHSKAKRLQGTAMYRMRYGLFITVIASVKMTFKQGKLRLLWDNLAGFTEAWKNKTPFLVTREEGRFIRRYRLKGIGKYFKP